ncbi:MAG: hypothetical protein OCD76_06745 [Reichenbachiella sp.]
MKSNALIILFLFLLPEKVYSQLVIPPDFTKNIYQDASILLANNDTIQCKIKVFKIDTLHHTDRIKYRLANKKHNIRIDKIKWIKLGESIYTNPYVDKYPKLCSLVVDGVTPIYVSFHFDSSPFPSSYGTSPMVIDNADYIKSDFYILKNGRYFKIEDPRHKYAKEGLEAALSTPEKRAYKEHKYVLKMLKKIYPECSFLEIDFDQQQIQYIDIPNLVLKANQL